MQAPTDIGFIRGSNEQPPWHSRKLITSKPLPASRHVLRCTALPAAHVCPAGLRRDPRVPAAQPAETSPRGGSPPSRLASRFRAFHRAGLTCILTRHCAKRRPTPTVSACRPVRWIRDLCCSGETGVYSSTGSTTRRKALLCPEVTTTAGQPGNDARKFLAPDPWPRPITA
jgi:hypothetical protein